MRIAVTTVDNTSITAHFGHSDRFAIYDVQAGNASLVEVRKSNGAPHDPNHTGGHDHNTTLDLLGDCSAIVSGGMGSFVAKLMSERGIEPVVAADCGQLPEAAALAFAEGKLQRGAIHACCCSH